MQTLSPPLIRLYLWPQRLLLLGPGFDTGLHRHHAAQVCVGLEGPLRLRKDRDAPWLTRPGFYVPPDHPHEFDAAATSVAIVYVEAESAEFEALRARFPRDAAAPVLHADAETLAGLKSLLAEGGPAQLADACCLSLMGLPASADRPRALDPRIGECLSVIDRQLDCKIRLAELARHLQVSQSWLAHRFSEQVGLPMRRYVLWQRLRRAIGSALQGQTLTEAAHAAGFSDSAHLSRSFRGNFGVAPSFLFEHRSRIACTFG